MSISTRRAAIPQQRFHQRPCLLTILIQRLLLQLKVLQGFLHFEVSEGRDFEKIALRDIPVKSYRSNDFNVQLSTALGFLHIVKLLLYVGEMVVKVDMFGAHYFHGVRHVTERRDGFGLC